MTWRGAIEILGLGEGLAFKRWHQEKKKKKRIRRGRQFHTLLMSYREKFCKVIISSGLSPGSALAG